LLVGAALIISVAANNEKGGSAFYREHEKYAQGNIYEKSVNDIIAMQHGDLYALDGGRDVRREKIKEQRTVEFITDEWGFRNNTSSISKSEIVLVGDSFIVANGTTQSETPANVLSSLSGKAVSSLAYPDDPRGYEKRIREHLAYLDKNAAVYVFYYEGNDFEKETKSRNGATIGRISHMMTSMYWRMENAKERVLNRFYSKNNIFVRTVRARAHLIIKHLLEPTSPVDYIMVGGKDVGFLKISNSLASANRVTAYIFQDPIVLQRLKGVFFIPTKFRTYSRQIGVTIPNSSFEYLGSSYANLKIPVFDLTPGLQIAADELLDDGRFVYWRDDTHWNGLGIAAAMKCVAYFLNPSETLGQRSVCE